VTSPPAARRLREVRDEPIFAQAERHGRPRQRDTSWELLRARLPQVVGAYRGNSDWAGSQADSAQLLELAQRAHAPFESQSAAERRKLRNFVLPNALGRRVNSPKTTASHLTWLWELAERVGFEPTLELPLNTLSKRAPSTTRPSLRSECGLGLRSRELRRDLHSE
jgi:hypothetical protein